MKYRNYTIETGDFGFRCDHVTTTDLAQLKRYIDGWIADEEYEARCDGLASRRLERDYQ